MSFNSHNHKSHKDLTLLGGVWHFSGTNKYQALKSKNYTSSNRDLFTNKLGEYMSEGLSAEEAKQVDKKELARRRVVKFITIFAILWLLFLFLPL